MDKNFCQNLGGRGSEIVCSPHSCYRVQAKTPVLAICREAELFLPGSCATEDMLALMGDLAILAFVKDPWLIVDALE